MSSSLPDPALLPPPNLVVESLPAAPAPELAAAPPPPPSAAVLKPLEPDLKASDWLGILRDAASYPMRKDGWYILIPGAFLGLAWVIGSTFGSLVSSFPLVFGLAYFSAFYLSIVEATIIGKDEVPEWPALSNMGQDFVMPFFVVVTTFLLAALPSIAFAFATSNVAGAEMGSIAFFMYIVGQAYIPMALLSYAATGSFGSIFPWKVLPAITRCNLGYVALAAITCVAGLVVSELVERFFTFSIFFSFADAVGSFLTVILQFYWMIVHGRLVGLFYRRYQHKLDW